MTISALCISLILAAPQKPIAVRKAPTKFSVPWTTDVGPKSSFSSVVFVPTLMRVPLGKAGWG